jgi:hypothetical protein
MKVVRIKFRAIKKSCIDRKIENVELTQNIYNLIGISVPKLKIFLLSKILALFKGVVNRKITHCLKTENLDERLIRE